ncbi:hypothetical protein ACWGJP_02740 [Microbacterium sp. NPDC055903]
MRGAAPAGRLRRRRDASAPDDLISRLADALARRDGADLRALLHPGVLLVIDTGGIVGTPREPQRGRVAAVEGMLELACSAEVSIASVNGVDGIVVRQGATVVGVVSAERDGASLRTIWIVRNPAKIGAWNRERSDSPSPVTGEESTRS